MSLNHTQLISAYLGKPVPKMDKHIHRVQLRAKFPIYGAEEFSDIVSQYLGSDGADVALRKSWHQYHTKTKNYVDCLFSFHTLPLDDTFFRPLLRKPFPTMLKKMFFKDLSFHLKNEDLGAHLFFRFDTIYSTLTGGEKALVTANPFQKIYNLTTNNGHWHLEKYPEELYLLHELIHVYHYVFNPKKYHIECDTRSFRWGDKEEHRTIAGPDKYTEHNFATALGLRRRLTHHGFETYDDDIDTILIMAIEAGADATVQSFCRDHYINWDEVIKTCQESRQTFGLEDMRSHRKDIINILKKYANSKLKKKLTQIYHKHFKGK